MSQQAFFRVVDLETTGFLDEQSDAIKADPVQGIVEIGHTDVHALYTDEGRFVKAEISKPGFMLYKPPAGIPPQSMAIHHITPAMVREMPPCTAGQVQLVANSPPEPLALVAHNAAFEREWLSPYLPKDQRWLCTYKVAKQLHPNWPSHSNQACRYLMGLELDERWCFPPHRGGPDTWVTAHNLVEFLKLTTVRQMIEWTAQPTLLIACPIGEHRGKPWVEVPEDFLRWIIDKAKQMDPDTKYWAQRALQDRAAMRANPDLSASDY